MQQEDLALFWSTGSESGLYALGRIAGELFERDKPLYTKAEHEFAIPYRATLILDEPILRSSLLTHPVLKDLTVIQAPQGTNFKVSPEQWAALRGGDLGIRDAQGRGRGASACALQVDGRVRAKDY
jgi:EVE domain